MIKEYRNINKYNLAVEAQSRWTFHSYSLAVWNRTLTRAWRDWTWHQSRAKSRVFELGSSGEILAEIPALQRLSRNYVWMMKAVSHEFSSCQWKRREDHKISP